MSTLIGNFVTATNHPSSEPVINLWNVTLEVGGEQQTYLTAANVDVDLAVHTLVGVVPRPEPLRFEVDADRILSIRRMDGSFITDRL